MKFYKLPAAVSIRRLRLISYSLKKERNTTASSESASSASRTMIKLGVHRTWRAAKTAFNPPNAKELFRIARMGIRRASFGT